MNRLAYLLGRLLFGYARPLPSPTRSSLIVTCPCGRSFPARADDRGADVRCFRCGRMVRVPG
jgi:hypothetical protein